MLEAGRKVAAVARREEIASVLAGARGPVLRDEKGERTVRGDLEVFVRPPAQGAYDFILLATPPNGVEAAARDTAHLLAPDGAMVVLQNGLCEELGPGAGGGRGQGARRHRGLGRVVPGDGRSTSRTSSGESCSARSPASRARGWSGWRSC